MGATVEERGHDLTVTAGAVHDLLHDAMTVLPVTSELILAETCAGLRPGTPDNGPVVGFTGLGGLLVATGHYRNGILLSAATADAAVACLTGQRPAEEWEPFSPQRFSARDSGDAGRSASGRPGRRAVGARRAVPELPGWQRLYLRCATIQHARLSLARTGRPRPGGRRRFAEVPDAGGAADTARPNVTRPAGSAAASGRGAAVR